MAEFARLAPPYSIVAVEDISRGEPPKLADSSRIAATESCIIVGTLCEIDGETEFRLGTRREVDPGTAPAFQGRLKTPSGKLVIRSVPVDIDSDDIILEMPAPQPEAMIYIWTNHPTEPDQIIIGVE
jgi:hypothetical protein